MSDSGVVAPTWLTSEYLQKVLQDFYHDNTVQIQDFRTSSASSAGDGYLGQIYRIHIDFTKQNEKQSRSMIAKGVPFTEFSQELSKQFDVYKTELKMMETLPLLYEELRSKGETEPFFPYLYKLDKVNKTILMQDLKPHGYVVFDRTVSADLDHALLAMEAIAKFHASGYVLLKKNPDLKEDFTEQFKREKGNIMEKFSEGIYRYLLKSLHLWPLTEEDKQILRSLQPTILDMFFDSFQRKESGLNVIVHADFSIRNMMFRYKDGKINSVKLHDFQGCHLNSIAVDLHYFMFSSVDADVLMEHLEDLLAVYYKTFIRIVGEDEGITLDRIRNEFMDRIELGFTYIILNRPFTCSKKFVDINAFMEDRDTPDNEEMMTNKKYIMDVVKLLPLFKKHGVFK